MKSTLALLSVLCMTFSCKSDPKVETTPTKMQEVIAVHDEVMPKMGTISKLVAQLKPMADSTEAGMRYTSAMRDLQEAHKSMMDWMQGFGKRFDFDEINNGKELSPEKQQWLLEEEQKVYKLRQDINGSIERAQALLKED